MHLEPNGLPTTPSPSSGKRVFSWIIFSFFDLKEGLSFQILVCFQFFSNISVKTFLKFYIKRRIYTILCLFQIFRKICYVISDSFTETDLYL